MPQSFAPNQSFPEDVGVAPTTPQIFDPGASSDAGLYPPSTSTPVSYQELADYAKLWHAHLSPPSSKFDVYPSAETYKNVNWRDDGNLQHQGLAQLNGDAPEQRGPQLRTELYNDVALEPLKAVAQTGAVVIPAIVPELAPAEADLLAAAEGVEAGGIRITQKGLDIATEHLAQFGEHASNQPMLDRLGSAVGSRVTGADANFYLHEISESTMMGRGMSYEAAHAAAIEKYGVSPFSLYHPEVIQQFPGEFNNAWRAYWGIQ